MGANLLVIAGTLLLPSLQHDSTRQFDEPAHGFGYERLSDLLQYNRVQGLSFGLGYQARLNGSRSLGAYSTVRYGMSDERVTWRLSLVQSLRHGSLRLSGYYDLLDVDPLSPGRTVSNSVNAIFAGHDNGDYVMGRGGSLSWETMLGSTLLLELEARVERQSSAARTAHSAVNDFLGGTGLFPPNPPTTEGTFGIGSVGLSGLGKFRWKAVLDGLGGSSHSAVRVRAGIRRTLGSAPTVTLQLKTGAGTEPALPELLFRLGGLNTVRGFEYGTLRGSAFWAAQLDIALLPGRVRPVVFLDAGQVGRLGDVLSSSALVGAGAGVAFFKGLVRFELSHPVSPDSGGKLRFDVIVRGF